MHQLSNTKVILEPLTLKDADFFYNMYAMRSLQANFDESAFLPEETPAAFTARIIAACEGIWTIRTVAVPEVAVGNCALHHWNREAAEMAIGGGLLPTYWGKGMMQSAFELLIEVARQEFKVKALLGHTKTRNVNAIRLVEKMGFFRVSADAVDTIMKKIL